MTDVKVKADGRLGVLEVKHAGDHAWVSFEIDAEVDLDELCRYVETWLKHGLGDSLHGKNLIKRMRNYVNRYIYRYTHICQDKYDRNYVMDGDYITEVC